MNQKTVCTRYQIHTGNSPHSGQATTAVSPYFLGNIFSSYIKTHCRNMELLKHILSPPYTGCVSCMSPYKPVVRVTPTPWSLQLQILSSPYTYGLLYTLGEAL